MNLIMHSHLHSHLYLHMSHCVDYTSMLLLYLHSYVFECNKWLAVDKDDGETYAIMEATDQSECGAFNKLFPVYRKRAAVDYQLGRSLVRTPEYTVFTRVQRLSCFLAILMLNMASNAMWFGKEPQKDVSGFTIGPFEITYFALYSSLVGNMTVLIPTFLMVELFRSVKPIHWIRRDRTRDQADTASSDIPLERRANERGGTIPKRNSVKVVAAYIVCVLSISAGAFFSLLYSLDWGKKKTVQWLWSISFSFTESVFVMEPTMVRILINYRCKCTRGQPFLHSKQNMYTCIFHN